MSNYRRNYIKASVLKLKTAIKTIKELKIIFIRLCFPMFNNAILMDSY